MTDSLGVDFTHALRNQQDASEGFRFFGYEEVLNEPPKRFLVKGLLAMHDLAMLYGEAKVGKSLVVLDLIAALIRGFQSFAGKYAVKDPVRVVYATSEGLSGLPNRLRGLHEKWGHSDEERKRLSIVKQVPQLYRADSASSIHRFVADFVTEFGPDGLKDGLLVIDTWARATGGADENTTKDTTEILNALKEAADALGCTILAVHHANKGGGIRGSSNIQAGFDNVIHVRWAGERTRVMGCAIAKDAGVTEDVTFELVALRWDHDGEEQDATYVTWGDELGASIGRTEADKRNVMCVLTQEAKGEENAKSLTEILERTEPKMGKDSAQKALDALLSEETARVSLVMRMVEDKNGRKGRNAKHYFVSVDCMN